MVNGLNGYFWSNFMVESKVFILTIGNLYFGHGHGQNGYFCGLISWSNFSLTILSMENLDFGRGHGRNFDHLTMVILKFWPWPWSKKFDHITMTVDTRGVGQMVKKSWSPYPPPPLVSVAVDCGNQLINKTYFENNREQNLYNPEIYNFEITVLSYLLFKVQDGSPGFHAGLEPFFDFIVAIGNTRLVNLYKYHHLCIYY